MAILLIVVWSKKSSENFGRNYLSEAAIMRVSILAFCYSNRNAFR